MKEIEIAVKNFTDALEKLTEGVEEAQNELDRDGVIQRFEFTFELSWKALKLILEYEGFDCRSPRSCIKEAFRRNIIVDSELYLDMLEDRNRSSHVYDEQTSVEIFEHIKKGYVNKLSEMGDKFQRYVVEM